jgi:hypothetical protein
MFQNSVSVLHANDHGVSWAVTCLRPCKLESLGNAGFEQLASRTVGLVPLLMFELEKLASEVFLWLPCVRQQEPWRDLEAFLWRLEESGGQALLFG